MSLQDGRNVNRDLRNFRGLGFTKPIRCNVC